MRRAYCLGAATILLLCCRANGVEMYLGPLEALCARSDLIVVGKFVESVAVDANEARSLQDAVNATGFQKESGVLRRCTFEVTDTIKRDGNTQLKRLSALAHFQGEGKVMIICPAQFVSLTPGASYVLIMNRLPGGKEYYVSPRRELTSEGTPARLEEVKMAADPDRWNWSQPANGLSLAVRVNHYATEGGGRGVCAVLAVRNTSGKGVVLNLNETGGAAVLAREADGNSVQPQHDAYSVAVIREGNAPSAKPLGIAGFSTSMPWAIWSGSIDPVPLPPGRVVILRDNFFHLKTGRGTMQGTLEVQAGRESSAWSGKVSTETVRIEEPRNSKAE
jgi:hypothetical protein